MRAAHCFLPRRVVIWVNAFALEEELEQCVHSAGEGKVHLCPLQRLQLRVDLLDRDSLEGLQRLLQAAHNSLRMDAE